MGRDSDLRRGDSPSKRTRFLCYSAASLLATYGFLIWFNPLGYGTTTTTTTKRLTTPSSLMTVSVGDKNQELEALMRQMDQLTAEHAILQKHQKALLQAVEKALNGQDLVDSLKDLTDKDNSLLQGDSSSGETDLRPLDAAAAVPSTEDSSQPTNDSPPNSLPPESQGRLLTLRHSESHAFIYVDDNEWLVSNGDDGIPLLRRAFEVSQQDGATLLKSLFTERYVRLVPPGQEPSWVFIADGTSVTDAHKFDLKDEAYIYNPSTRAYMNIIDNADGAVRGHGNDPRKGQAAEKEPTTQFMFTWVTHHDIEENTKELERRKKLEQGIDDDFIAQIKDLPPSTEKRVISYGLYGSNPKYTQGAIRNAQLVDTYFPGWVARFYYDDTVPSDVIKDLKDEGAEVVKVEGMRGGIAGMFWRFLVADDPDVDRYVVRDSDSRLNARDRLAIEDWIQSNKSVHSIRDHVNHCRPLNGGLWGGVKGGIKDMTGKVQRWSHKQSYGADLDFLNEAIWPEIKDDQISHDAYCCEQFPNAQPFPTKRYTNYQHVGQVFDENDKPRMDDIDRFIKGKVIPEKCRKRSDWVHG